MQVVILGAGPAGMTCANALLTFGIKSVVIERSAHAGGAQRTNFHPNLWLLGSPEETGREVTERMVRHFTQLPIPLYLNTEITRVTPAGNRFEVGLRQTRDAQISAIEHTKGEDASLPPDPLQADAIVIATGMRPRATLALKNLAQQSDRVIIGALSDLIRIGIQDARVLILGGGDNALDHALYLAERGNRATVCTRHAFSARPGFKTDCAKQGRIEMRENCSPSILAADTNGIRAEWPERQEHYDWLLVMYGYEPNTELLHRFASDIQPKQTAPGYIHTDIWQRTSVPGLYAAGDITESIQPSVAIAIAQGLSAAKAIERLSQG